MKGLLHSKTFKANLRKWLFMYVGTLCILSSVITYSKYMSSCNSSNEARPAKFNIKINYVDTCENNDDGESCSTDENIRPLENYEFYFKVDTTEVEVASNIAILAEINTTYKETFSKVKIVEVDETLKNVINEEPDMSYTLLPQDTGVRYYKVIVKHKITQQNSIGNSNNNSVLTVGYSVEQIG